MEMILISLAVLLVAAVGLVVHLDYALKAEAAKVAALNLDRVNLVQQMTVEFNGKLERKEADFEKRTQELKGDFVEEWNKTRMECAEKLERKEAAHEAELELWRKHWEAAEKEHVTRIVAIEKELHLARADEAVEARNAMGPVRLYRGKRARTEAEARLKDERVKQAMGSLTPAHPVWQALETVLVGHWWANHMAATSAKSPQERNDWLMRSTGVEDVFVHLEQLVGKVDRGERIVDGGKEKGREN